MSGEIIISIAYGLDVLPEDDPFIAAAEKGVYPLVVAAVPGTFLVDTFPWLKYVPDWMPFAGFKRKAKEWRELTMGMIEKPFEAGKRKFVRKILLQSTFAHQSSLPCRKMAALRHRLSHTVLGGLTRTRIFHIRNASSRILLGPCTQVRIPYPHILVAFTDGSFFSWL
jgi:hypothetical protein